MLVSELPVKSIENCAQKGIVICVSRAEEMRRAVQGRESWTKSKVPLTFGLSTTHLVGRPMWHCALTRAFMTTDLPPPVGPTSMVECRVIMVSYICTTLSSCARYTAHGTVTGGNGSPGGLLHSVAEPKVMAMAKAKAKANAKAKKALPVLGFSCHK